MLKQAVRRANKPEKYCLLLFTQENLKFVRQMIKTNLHVE